ncbi:heterokaryon incompatibility protein-domain-containing protein [Annulohypoxylon moriforme]|nr:heterokaryon incompatibility protein-domain-containing protein [Annulohypoxylon moriforme]
MDHLCARCKVLELDDKALGGHRIQNGGREESLELPLEQPDIDGDGNIPLDYQLRDNFPEFPKLVSASQAGCDFCKLLKDAIDEFVQFKGDQVVDISIEYRWSQSLDGNLGLTGLFATLKLADHAVALQYPVPNRQQSLRFLIDGEPGKCSQWLNLRRPLIAHALHPDNLAMVREELDQCQKEHEHQLGNQVRFLPTRLIEIRNQNSKTEFRLVLTDSRMKRKAPRYAALSYCWGSPSESETQFKTEKATLTDRISGFSFNSMTQVMRDAVTVARALSISYIWIDALCIVQDDRIDWERESTTMADVYRQAYITICTPGSSSCHQGFLERRPKSVAIPFKSNINPEVKGSYNVRIGGRTTPSNSIVEGMDLTYDELYHDHSSWSQRAWTFQEAVLSTRTLHFGSFELSYQCPDRVRSEAGLSSYPSETDVGIFNDLANAPARHAMWNELMSRYTPRHLTHETDRLPAISGLARIMGNSPKDYYAGLWKQSLVVDLCWIRHVDDISPADTRDEVLRLLDSRQPYIAPSWSWAARKQSFEHLVDINDYRDETRSVAASTTPRGLDPFGQVKDGLLTVRGVLVPLPSDIIHDPPPEARHSLFHYKYVYEKDRRIAQVSLDWWMQDPEDETELSMLLLTSYLYPFEGLHRRVRVGFGIILHPSKTSGRYVRVGAFMTDKHGFGLFQRSSYQTVKIL